MTVKWDDVTRAEVLRAIQEYDRLGPEEFFSEHGFGPTTTYDLSGTNVPTRRKQSWAPRMNSPPASALPPVTSRAARPAPYECSGT
jgi:hypothetical protein